jgi:hypothetical protein
MPNSISKQIFVLLIRSPYRQTISSPSDIATGRPLLRRTENADERDLGDKETEVYNLLTASTGKFIGCRAGADCSNDAKLLLEKWGNLPTSGQSSAIGVRVLAHFHRSTSDIP